MGRILSGWWGQTRAEPVLHTEPRDLDLSPRIIDAEARIIDIEPEIFPTDLELRHPEPRARPSRDLLGETLVPESRQRKNPEPPIVLHPELVDEVRRTHLRVTTSDGAGIFVCEVHPLDRDFTQAEPLVLVHGAHVPGRASFDLPVAGGSLAADLALRTGRAVYVMDARNHGGSDRSTTMRQDAKSGRPQTRGYEVVRDIDAVVQEAARRTQSRKVALFGWGAGGAWAGAYAAANPERIGHLITLNALYGGSASHPLLGPSSPNADPAQPHRFNRNCGAYLLRDEASLFTHWDADHREPEIAKAYAEAILASDPASGAHQPKKFRSPTGPLEDSFYLASGRRLYDAGSITSPALVIRSEHDVWSRPEDVEAFLNDAGNSTRARGITLAGARHHVHLDRPEYGRDRLLNEIVTFWAEQAGWH